MVERTDLTMFRCEADNNVMDEFSTGSQEYNLIVNCELILLIIIIFNSVHSALIPIN